MKDVKMFALGMIVTIATIMITGIAAATIFDAGNGRISNVATPSTNQDAANKAYVDAAGGSPADWSCTTRIERESSATGVSVTCLGNEKVISGGCLVSSNVHIRASRPLDQGWACTASSTGWIEAHANCCS